MNNSGLFTCRRLPVTLTYLGIGLSTASQCGYIDWEKVPAANGNVTQSVDAHAIERKKLTTTK